MLYALGNNLSRNEIVLTVFTLAAEIKVVKANINSTLNVKHRMNELFSVTGVLVSTKLVSRYGYTVAHFLNSIYANSAKKDDLN